MNTLEIRNLDLARQFLTQGLWLQRVVPPVAGQVAPVLEWALEAAAAGQPLPPIGFLADLGHAAFGQERSSGNFPEVPGMPPGLARTYEDHVLGKLYADWTFERAGDALRRYQGRDRARGLAFCLQQFRERANFGGVHLSPAVIKGLLDQPPDEVLATGWRTLSREGLLAIFPELYEALVVAARRTADVLAPEDVFELEHGTALAPMGQRVALRQVLQAAARLDADLPRLRPRPLARRQQVATHLLDEDAYPVGGFASISTRGTIESLLHSQLAYMEPDDDDRPDLFDVKYLRDELLYYSRDENQFLRRRRTFVFALYPDLVQTRVKDADIPWQRGVLLFGLLTAAVRKLTEWLSTDALRFEFVWVSDNEAAGLAVERDLVETLLREAIANGTAAMERTSSLHVAAHVTQCGRRSLCDALLVSCGHVALTAEDAVVSRLQINGSRPSLGLAGDTPAPVEAETTLETWGKALQQLLEPWV